jgi:hypothetical protein
MSLAISYCKLLALRAHNTPGRRPEECLPQSMSPEKVYPFDKSEQRVFDIQRTIPLHETKGGEQLSRPIALIEIIEPVHYKKDGDIWTRGKYRVKRLISPSERLIWGEGDWEIESR